MAVIVFFVLQAKLKASLSWLISKAFCDKIPSVYAELFLEDAKVRSKLGQKVGRTTRFGRQNVYFDVLTSGYHIAVGGILICAYGT